MLIFLFALMCYITPGKIHSLELGWPDQISSVPRVPQYERFFRAFSSASGSKVLLRPEQKNKLWITALILKFTLLGGLVVNYCSNKFIVTKPCMLLQRHRQIVGYNLDLECDASSHLQIAVILAPQLSNEESDTIGDVDVQQAASCFSKAMEELNLKLCIELREMPTGFPILQNFPCTYCTRYQLIIWGTRFTIVKTTLQRISEHLVCVCDWTGLTSVLCKRQTAV